MTAIITDVRYRMSLALIRDLGSRGIRIICCETDECGRGKTVPLGFYSKYCNESHIFPKSDYEKHLYSLCESVLAAEGEKPVLLPVGAFSLGILAKDHISHRFEHVCFMCIPKGDPLDIFNDKESVLRLGMELGIPTPKSYSNPFSDAAFPCIVKPSCGEKFGLPAEKRYIIAHNREELEAGLRRFKEITGQLPLVQQYLPGEGLGCSVLAVRGEIVSYICHRRIREYPISGGPSSCCAAIIDEGIKDWAAKLVKSVGYTGLAMVEFKRDSSGVPRLLEINPRIWGSFPLTRAARSSLSISWFNSARIGECAPAVPAGSYKTVKMAFFPSDIMAGIKYLKAGKPGKFFASICDFFNPAVKDGVWEWGDMRPALKYYLSLFKRRG